MASEKQIVETSSPHVQRYFRPLAVRMRFSPERLISPGLHSRRRVFSPEPRGAIPLDVDPYEPKKKKPHGEVTRVGRNGYNLQAALGWTDKFYAEVQLSIHELARVHLDTRLSFAMQKKDLVKKVFEEANRKHPELNYFEKDWATKDFLIIFLKNAAQRERERARQKEKASGTGDKSH